ncbi:hypothetical protein ACO229_07230 [Promicromonospora sp. MS192]|uniref:hypothetical protein n=1 Tax=Promicromonospora sp. MS192 TaxID=3412684 RepID=UPI003C2F7AA3
MDLHRASNPSSDPVAAMTRLSRRRASESTALPRAVVEKMALDGVDARYIVPLLEPHLASLGRDQLFTILQALSGDYPKLAEVGRDKPRIPNTHADRALLEHLKLEGIVGKYDDLQSPIKVNKKYK